jgi:hypothetical protein
MQALFPGSYVHDDISALKIDQTVFLNRFRAAVN